MRVKDSLAGLALCCAVLAAALPAAAVSDPTPRCKRAIEEVHEARTVVAESTRFRDAKGAAFFDCLEKNPERRAACEPLRREYDKARAQYGDALAALSFVTAQQKRVCR